MEWTLARRVRIAGVLAVLMLGASAAVQAAEPELRVRREKLGGEEFVPGELIVQFKTGTLASFINQILSQQAASVVGTSRSGAGFVRVRVPGGAGLEQALQRFRQNPAVAYAEPNHIAHADWVPNDPLYVRQWHLDNPGNGGVQAEQAWDLQDGDPSVVVAVIDTGVAYEDYSPSLTQRYYRAPDLAQTCFVPGYDFVNEDTHPNDDEGHGTHVTGTIAQSTNNATGAAGLAFQSCIMPIKVLSSTGSGTYSDVADGIRYAADHGAKVINMSLSGSSSSLTLKNALVYARDRGVTIACSSGNNGSATVIGYPAAYDECLAVGATRYDEAVAYYSNRGAALDIVAPGGDLNVDQNADGSPDGVLQQTFGNATNDWGYFWYSGTSMAAPHVAAAAALVIAEGHATTPQEVRTALLSTAKDKGAAGWDSTYGWGLLNVQAALLYGETANQPPVADAGADQSAGVGQTVTFNGANSSDPDGSIASHVWNFGDGSAQGNGANVSHSYTTAGTYTVTLTVTDNQGQPDSDTATVTVTQASASPLEVFLDSFEPNPTPWAGNWTQDAQNDWYRSVQRATNGRYSAEVDGAATNAQLISKAINLQGRTSATITFSWYIESGLDTGEYLAFDVSTDGGATWTEKARLRANVDPENAWQAAQVNLTGISTLRLRFRGRMSDFTEDADVDLVKVIAQ